MGALVPIFSENIRMEDMTLDFSLEAARSDYPDQSFSYDGKDTVIGPYRDGYAFGITSIEIDTSLNMQPQIEITFKDLYGNLVFKTGGDNNYSKLFELPPPKFTLTFKGYVGKPIQYLLQLRSTSVNYVTSDGSYEIKSKFVPNIYGFFGDIPYKFIYSVDKLKEGRGTTSNSSSILNIVKNGALISETVQTASEQYADLKSKLTTIQGALAGDGTTFYNAISAGTFSNTKTVLELSNIQSNVAGFTGLTFNFNNKKTGYFPSIAGEESLYGVAAARSINSRTQIDLNKNDWRAESEKLSTRTAELNNLITGNLNAIDNATNKSAGSQISQEVLDSQTISSVMGSLAGGSAYVLGYILEGALVGLKKAPEEKRRKDDKMIGLYYPLVYQENNTAGANGDTVYEQIPDPNAVTEMQYVQTFMKAQYEGTQQIKKFKEEQEAKENGTEGAIRQGAELKKRLTNAEAFKANPYAGANSNQIAANMIQRSGLIATRVCGPLEKDGGPNDRKKGLIDSEYENIKIGTDVLSGNDLEDMRTFAKRVTTFFGADGNPKLKFTDFTDTGNTMTYQTYFEKYFESMKTGGLDDKMFKNSNKNTLSCNYFICNNMLYQNENDLYTVFQKPQQNLYVYVPSDKATLTSTLNSTGATDVSETLNGKAADTTKPYEDTFYAFEKATDWNGLGDAGNPTLVISYDKLTGGYLPVKEMFIKIAKTAADGVVVPEDGSYVAPFSYISSLFKSYLVDMKGVPDTVAPLVSWCTNLISQLPIDNSEADKRKAEQEKQPLQNNYFQKVILPILIIKVKAY
jgi:hypothetical protein